MPFTIRVTPSEFVRSCSNLCRCCSLDTSDIGSMCSTNADLAGRVGRADLVQMWSMLSLIVLPALDPSPHPDDEPWAAHPFGRQTIKSLYVSRSLVVFVSLTVAVYFCNRDITRRDFLQYFFISENFAPQARIRALLNASTAFEKILVLCL